MPATAATIVGSGPEGWSVDGPGERVPATITATITGVNDCHPVDGGPKLSETLPPPHRPEIADNLGIPALSGEATTTAMPLLAVPPSRNFRKLLTTSSGRSDAAVIDELRHQFKQRQKG
jgi:hypothetical protein